MSLLFPQLYISSPSRCSGARYVPSRCGPASARCGSGSSRYRGPAVWNFLDNTFDEIQRASREVERSYTPRFDVKESKDHFTLTGEVPGVDQEDISIEFTDEKTLQIKGHTETHTKTGKRPQSEKEQAATTPAPITEGAATSDSASTRTLQATVEDVDDEAANNGDHEWIDVTANEKQKQKQPVQPESQENEKEAAAETTEKPEAQETKQPECPKEPQSWLSERHYGEFSRTFQFATRVDRYGVTASLKNGLLRITVPKAAAPETRRINIE